MDVKCHQCGLEYDLDDSRITPEGVTVKCTSCGHIFKVKQEVRLVTEPVLAPARIESDWMVRQGSGNMFKFKELTTLQRWIVERKVSRDDVISKTGQSWKRLGDIAELASFFQVVDDAEAHRAASATAIPLQNPILPLTASAVAAAPRAPAPVPDPVPAPAPAQAQRAAPTPTPTPAPAPVTLPEPVTAPAADSAPGSVAGEDLAAADALASGIGDDDTTLEQSALGAQVEAAISGVPEELLLDDDDPVRAWRRRRRLPALIAAAIAVLLLGTGGLYFFARPTFDALIGNAFKRGPSPETLQAVAEAERAVQLDVIVDLRRAEAALGAALQGDPDAIEPRAAKVAVAVALAEAADDELQINEQLYQQLMGRNPQGFAEGSPALKEVQAIKARAEKAGVEATRLFHDAVAGVKEILSLAPEDPYANYAAARYYRAKGAFDHVPGHLAKAAAVWGPQDLRVAMEQALMVQDSAAAITALQALLAQEPALGRARYQMVKLKGQAGDPEGAQQAARDLLAQIPGHERAKAWLTQKARLEAPAQDKPAPHPVAAKPEAQADSFDTLLAQAQRLRDRGDLDAALKLYAKAAEAQPQRAEPRAGQGWCYLDKGNLNAALGSFSSALDANPSYAEAHMGLAETHRARGNKVKAITHYQRYLEILPGGSDAAVAQRYLLELQGP